MSTELESPDTHRAREELLAALASFDRQPGQQSDVLRCVETLIDHKITDALEALSDRIEFNLGARP